MKKYFITGLATLLPLTITAIIVIWIIKLLTAPFVGLVEDFFHQFDAQIYKFIAHRELFLWTSRIIALILLVIFIVVLGFCTQKLFLGYFVRITDRIFERIPLVRFIYRTTREVSEAVLGKTENVFKNCVLVKFPHSKAHALGFKTAKAPKEVEKKLPDCKDVHSVFVPTAPHPISGFLLLMEQEQISQVDMKGEEVLKFLVSCGLFDPKEKE
ncbi:MAG: DUF502 domain-containing protein [Candidatus Algichlamydia australiensis]|nr:DUF502 domain-containing protein [Chlamydiales bacterium]